MSPPEDDPEPTAVWDLVNPACGLVYSVIVWYFTSGAALREFGLCLNSQEYCLHTKEDGPRVFLVVVTQADNYTYIGNSESMFTFENFPTKNFKVGEFSRNDFLNYNSHNSLKKKIYSQYTAFYFQQTERAER